MPRRVLPYQYNLPQVPETRNGGYMPGQIATTPQDERQQQSPNVPGGLLSEILKKPDLGPLASQLGTPADAMAAGWESALAGTPFAGGLGAATEAGFAPLMPAAYAAEPTAGLLGGAEAGTGFASMMPETYAGLESAMGIAPATEFATAAPAVEAGIGAGATDAGLAAAEGGLLGAGTLGTAGLLGLGGLGIYGLGTLFDWW